MGSQCWFVLLRTKGSICTGLGGLDIVLGGLKCLAKILVDCAHWREVAMMHQGKKTCSRQLPLVVQETRVLPLELTECGFLDLG